MTDAIVDADITHSYYTGVDTSLFTIFEITDDAARFGSDNGAAVALGLRDGTIGGGGFTGGGGNNAVPEPGSLVLLGAGLIGIASRRRKDKA